MQKPIFRRLVLRSRGCACRLLTRRTVSMLGSLVLLALTACQMFPVPQPTALGQMTATPAGSQTIPQASATPLDSTPPVVATPGPLTLRIWLPPQFDPSAATPAGEILAARLNEFTNQSSGIRVEVRLKALEGTGGLLESLAAANVAAPLALPDLIALPRPLLESAALKGLLYPYDELSEVMAGEGWYDYARQLAYLQESVFGLPFAGDVQVLAYRPMVLEVPPTTWDAALGIGSPLAFSAADTQALFTLNQYQASGGAVWDDQGRPTLDEQVLTKVLTFYQQASQAGVMPLWLTQLETNEQVWQAFSEQQAPMAVAWASSYFTGLSTLTFETGISPQITSDGSVYSLATGWVWALASPDPARRMQAAHLAEYLVDVQFLADWNSAAGFFPPHIDSLAMWGDEQLRLLVGRISLNAQLIPSDDLLSSLGPALEEAVILVLKQQADPQTAAKIAAGRVNQP